MRHHAPGRRLVGFAIAIVIGSGAGLGVPAAVSATGAPAGPDTTPGSTVSGGVTAPVFAMAEAIRETVHVTAEMDSDGDGRLDRIAVELIRPGETAQGLRVASVVRATPYTALSSSRLRRDLVIPSGDASPAHFGAWYDEYFVPRGYAVVEVDMQGTAGSEGCATTGGPEDTLSAKAAIDWLNGRATATYADGTPAVASWSTGAVGMIGTSYPGTLPIALAETGVEGLRTIVPIAAISSWYDYSRAHGIAYYGGWGSRYPEGLARIVSNSRALSLCDTRYRQLGDSAADDTYDFTPFYQVRDYRDRVDQVRASVLLVHGQRDDNVKTTQFGRYWDRLATLGVPRKLYLHDGAHVDPFGSDLVWRDAVGRWMDHWLYGIANGVMDEPQVTIKRPDGSVETHPAWPATGAVATTFHLGGPGSGAAGTLRASPVSGGTQQFVDNRGAEGAMINNPETAKPNRLVYLTDPLTAPRRLSGVGRLRLTFTSTSTSTPISALLVHYTNGVPTRVVARGAIDAKNRTSLAAGSPLVPGQQYAVTVELEPKDHVFPANSRIGVVVAANITDYLTSDPLAAGVTVDLRQSNLTLPLV